MDKPNNRSMHSIPTVRGGGVVFIGLPLIALPYLGYLTHRTLSEQILWLVTCLLIGGISFLDDLYQLSNKIRLIIQSLVAIILILYLKTIVLDFGFFTLFKAPIVLPFLFITVIWAINHFNFMDGLDGFCGFQALFLFCAYALLFHFHQAVFYQDICIFFGLSLIGFLVYNFPPAKLFMGDIGSATLGYILFALALCGQFYEQIPIVYWFMLNALFLFDSVVTLLRRIINKEAFFSAHRKHGYQRLKQLGVDTRFILLGQSFLNILFLILVLFSYFHKISVFLLTLIQISLLSLIYYAIERKSPFCK